MQKNQIRLRLNVVIAILAFIANAVLAFISYRLVLQVGGLELLGLWSALLSATFLIRIGDLGLGAAAVRYVAILPKDASIRDGRRLIDTILISNAALYLVLATVGFFVLSSAFPLFAGIAPDDDQIKKVSDVLPVLMVGFLFQGVSGAILAVLQGLYLGYLSSGLTVLGLLTQLFFALLLIPDHGLVGFASAMVAQNVMVMLVGWGIVLRVTRSRRAGILPINFSAVELRRTLKFGLGLQVVNILNGLFDPVAKLLIGRYSGLEFLGNFELAYRSINVIRGAVNSAVLATVPANAHLLKSDILAARKIYQETKRRTIIAMGGSLALAMLTSPLISVLWLGRFDVEFVLVLGTVAVGVMGNFFGAPAYTLGLASGRLSGNIISAAAAIATALILVPLGANMDPLAACAGAAIAMTLGGLLVKWRNERILLFP